MTPPKFISGEATLLELQLAISYEELAFRASTGSKIGASGGVNGNLVQFKDVSVYAGDLMLMFASAPTPAGHDAAWTATVIVQGSPRLIAAWRPAAMAIHTPGSVALAVLAAPAALVTMVKEAEALPDLQTHAAPSPYSAQDGKLFGADGQTVKQLSSPNHSEGNERKYLVVHYTAGTTLNGAVSWFMNKAASASAHLIIARDGSVVQMVPFTQRAWHAGESTWAGLHGLNGHSIGIELVNAGKLKRTAGGWVNWSNTVIPDSEVTRATHRNEQDETGWHEYTAAQIDTLFEIAVALHDAFEFKDILGHDDIAPTRKADPGPLFPMTAIRSRLFGRA